MTTPVTDGKMLVNATYHSAVVSGLAIGYARIAKMITFSGSNYLFSTLRKSNAKEVEEERKRHNKTLEQLEKQPSHNGPDAEWRD